MDLKLVEVLRKGKKMPMFFYRLFSVVPSDRTTERARKKARSTLISPSSEIGKIAIAFGEGKINKGSVVFIMEKPYIFLGANRGPVIPEIFLFFSEETQEFFRFACSLDGKQPL